MNGRKPNLVRGRNPKGNRDTVVLLASLIPPVLLRIEVAEHRVYELFGRPLRRVGEGDGVFDLVGDVVRVLGVAVHVGQGSVWCRCVGLSVDFSEDQNRDRLVRGSANGHRRKKEMD